MQTRTRRGNKNSLLIVPVADMLAAIPGLRVVNLALNSRWPAYVGYRAGQRPRSATIVITKDDGCVIGA